MRRASILFFIAAVVFAALAFIAYLHNRIAALPILMIAGDFTVIGVSLLGLSFVPAIRDWVDKN